MRVPDSSLDALRERGFAIVERFLDADELAAAQAALWSEFPPPAEYFADPARHEAFSTSQFAALKVGPWGSWELNRLAFHPDLVDLAARFLGSSDLRLYKTELWAKYAGAVDYDQPHHRDFGNHSLVVPDRARPTTQMTSFILLSDVTADEGPTMVVPFELGEHIPYWPPKQATGDLADVEVAITGPAGSLFVYRPDILHRGSQIRRPGSARFVLLADYDVWGTRWTGKAAWPNQALTSRWREMMERATPAERCLFGFPAPDDPYWNEQTVADVAIRYPQMDMTPYLR
jgi:hypothetical protein